MSDRHVYRPAMGWIPTLLLALCALAGPARADDPFLRRTATVRAVERVGPAVVNITTERQVRRANPFGRPFFRDPFFDRFFQDFFEPRVPQTVQSLGSGVIIDRERRVLTNEHVIARANRIFVTLADGREFDATLIGADPNNDLAVLQIDGNETLPWIQPGSSADLLVGEPVIAIGNPFGLSSTVTTGVISALDRSIRNGDRVYHGFLQTDAAINPGNSGGPLLNAEGQLVGINTAIYGGGAQGIGFAIPIDAARRVVGELIQHGEVAPVWLGLQLQDVDDRMHEALALPRGVDGAIVTRVASGSPAARAGVERGDVVTGIAGLDVHSVRGFHEILQSITVGQEVRIAWWRRGRSRAGKAVAAPLPEDLVAELAGELLGLQLEPRSGGGFRVSRVRPGSGAERIGIRSGDLLLRLNGLPLQDEDALRRSVLDLRGRTRALLVVQRGAGRYHVAVPLS